MRILLIHPQSCLHRHDTGIYGRSLRYAPITMPVLAALVPKELSAEVRIIDEMVEPIDFDDNADIIGITCIAGTALRAYEIANRFKKMNRTVVIGGVHASLMPDEASQHADAIVVGYAEEMWPVLLRDYACGQLKKRYQSQTPLTKYVPPLRNYILRSRYIAPNSVELFRGCGNKCEFCSSRVLFPTPVAREIDDVIDEISKLPGKMISFLDPNLITRRDVAYEFFKRLIPLRKWWIGCVTIDIAWDTELLDLLVKSGCKGLLIGFESVRQEALDSMNKSFNKVTDYMEAAKIIHSRRVAIEGCFVLGFDSDDKSIFDETFDFVCAAEIDYVHYTLYTPFPGTGLFRRFEKDGRIITRDWSLYNGRNVVINPRQMSADELQRGYLDLWSRTYSIGSIFKRLASSPGLYKVLTLASNLQVRHLQKKAAARSL